MNPLFQFMPYCGAPPEPSEIWYRWNFDPILLTAFGALAIAWLWHGMHDRSLRRDLAFASGLSIAVISFVSPLCALSVALFSARVAQHLILVLLAAPLIAFALERRFAGLPLALWSALLSVATFSVLFWFWHFPAPYAATLQSSTVYWAMHLSLFISAIGLWFVIMRQLQEAPLTGAVVALAAAIPMGLLSALLMFSSHVWHEWHALLAPAWGYSGAEDQTLAALLMWVPGSLFFLVITLAIFGRTAVLSSSSAPSAPNRVR